MGLILGLMALVTAGGIGALAWQQQHVETLEQQARQAEAAARVAEAAVEKLELQVIMQALKQAQAAQRTLTIIVVLLLLALIGIIALWIYTQSQAHRHPKQPTTLEQAVQYLILREIKAQQQLPATTEPDTALQTAPLKEIGMVVRKDDPFWKV